MRDILIISEIQSFLLMSIKGGLENKQYTTTILNGDTSAISKYKETVQGVLIFADKTLIDQAQTMFFLKDWALMYGTPLFVVGNPIEIREIEEIITKGLIYYSFTRPLNIQVSELADMIDTAIRLSQKEKKVLVVDDSGSMLRTVKEWLKDKYSVTLANSGAMAIKNITLNRPDLILLDYDMPVVDGKQVLEMIRTEADFATIPVMFLTVRSDAESIMRVRELRPDGYLLKSLSPAQIIEAVDVFFSKQKASV